MDRFYGAMEYRSTPLILLFMLTAMGFYLALAVVYPLPLGAHSPLFIRMVSFFDWIPLVWGGIGLGAFFLDVAGVYLNSRIMTALGATLHVVLWVFAGMTYLVGGYGMLFIAVALPQILFWAWNFSVRYKHSRVSRETKKFFRTIFTFGRG